MNAQIPALREQILQSPIFCVHATAAEAEDAWLAKPHGSALHHIEHTKVVIQFQGPRGIAVLDGSSLETINRYLSKRSGFRIHTHIEAFLQIK